jgi:protein-S-isoprenylcysteine O-methyltransferase Ste14
MRPNRAVNTDTDGGVNERLFPWAPWEFWVAASVAGAGMLFTVWARVELGGNWSGMVTIKHDHELIDNPS